jgi:hypothetical protein
VSGSEHLGVERPSPRNTLDVEEERQTAVYTLAGQHARTSDTATSSFLNCYRLEFTPSQVHRPSWSAPPVEGEGSFPDSDTATNLASRARRSPPDSAA